ncbi:hypothetical protein [Williamsia soli]|uniref:hypothetical protein n=1 Tax=Williamsia soli TaxID=364929 RepID=UPI001A9E8A6D|nr:hypothetical protein [Williamsia soli]
MTQCQKCGGRADAFLCRDCGQALVRDLDMIPWLATRLGESALKLTALSPTMSGPRRKVTEDEEQSPVPFNSWAHGLYDELRTVCMRWVRDLCDANGVPFWPIDAVPHNFIGPLPRRGIRRLPAAGYVVTTQDLSRWLSKNYLSIMNSEDAGMCANEIHATISRALTVINPRVPPAYRGPCPTVTGKGPRDEPLTCGIPLYAPHTNDTDPDSPIVDRITCPKCKEDHDTRVLEQQLLNDVGKYLMPASQVFQVMRELGEPIAKSTFYSWTSSRRLQPRGWEHKGRIVGYWIHRNDPPMFSIDDVRRLRRTSDKPKVGSRR